MVGDTSMFYLNSVSEIPALDKRTDSFPIYIDGHECKTRIVFADDEQPFSTVSPKQLLIKIESPLFVNRIEYHIEWEKICGVNNEQG